MGADAAGDAAQTQADSANQATALQRQMYEQQVGREAPFLQGGTNAFAKLQKLLGIGGGGEASSPLLRMLGYGAPGGPGQIDPRTFQGSPGYQYQLQQGQNAVTNATARNPGGNALRALQGVGQQTANQNWQQYLSNFGGAYQGLVGNLSGVAGMGQNAAANLGAAGAGFGNQAGSNMIGAGNALAAGQIGGANAMTGGINSALTAFGSNPQIQGWLKGLGGGGGGTDATERIVLNPVDNRPYTTSSDPNMNWQV